MSKRCPGDYPIYCGKKTSWRRKQSPCIKNVKGKGKELCNKQDEYTLSHVFGSNPESKKCSTSGTGDICESDTSTSWWGSWGD